MKKLFASPDSKFHDMATTRHRPFPLPRPLASLPTTLCAFLRQRFWRAIKLCQRAVNK